MFLTAVRRHASTLGLALLLTACGSSTLRQTGQFPAQRVDLSDSLAATPFEANGTARDTLPPALRRVTEQVQQAALVHGNVAVDRTAKQEVWVRLPFTSLWETRTKRLTPQASAFISRLGEALLNQGGVDVTLAFSKPPAGADAASEAVQRMLTTYGVPSSRCRRPLGNEGPTAPSRTDAKVGPSETTFTVLLTAAAPSGAATAVACASAR